MRSFIIFVVFLHLFCTDAECATGTSFDVPLIRSSLRKKRIARRRQYGRDGLSFLSTDDDDEDISVSTHSSRTSEYYGKIAIGRQEFLCVFDTGSGNLLIPTTTCTDDACLSHKLYDPKKSKTSRQIKFLEDETTNRTSFIDTDFEVQDRDVVSITFGTGEVSGILMQDQVCVGEICAETKFVGANSETSQPFELVPFDGILGLSLKEMSESSDFNFFQNLIDQKVLERNCFAVFFGDDNEPSEITFGSFKKERMLSKFHWVDVSVPGYWQISLEDIQVNNQKLNLCAENNGCNVAIDTGTSLLAAPSSIVEQLAESLNINEDCTNYDTLPNLGFIISGKLLSLDKSDYVDRNGNDCILGLMSLDLPSDGDAKTDTPLLIFGDPFLRKFYTVFEVMDDGTPRVGFAYAKHRKNGDHGLRDR